jgi:hypothetical protein
MKPSFFKHSVFRILVAVLIIFSGGAVYSEQGGVVQTIKKATAPFNDENIDAGLAAQKNTVLVKAVTRGEVFRTETRKDKMERFKCSHCHIEKKVTVARAAEIAHGDIVLDHGGQNTPLSCFTCHKEDERDFLFTDKGVKVDMDHSYQMCGQCHFRQRIDWVGGAHGKRISYWAGRRVVKNCASCHNPHSPRFDKRWPKTYSLPLDE